MIKLLIADDHSQLVEGIKHVLSNTNVEVVGSVSNACDVLGAYKSHNPDVLLCDFKLGFAESKSFTVIKSLLDYDAAAKVIIFSQYDLDTYIRQSYNEGAKCFLRKFVSPKELIEVITNVSAGINVLPLL
jgi:two-component system, NarL family, invasion response regulator UvrY